MGAVFSIIVEAIEVAAATGYTFESIITGTIGGAIAAEVETLVTVEGLELAQALSVVDISPELYSFLTQAPITLNNYIYGGLAASSIANIIGSSSLLASYLQTKSGLSTDYLFGRPLPVWETPDANMALQLWRPDYLEEFVPGLRSVEYFVSTLTGWTGQLLNSASQLFWRAIQRETEREIARISREAAQGYSQRALQAITQVLQTAKYTLIESPVNVYQALRDYYSQLSLSPPQLADVNRRLTENYGVYADIESEELDTTTRGPLSGEYVVRYQTPGGTNHLASPDWLILLLLGILGQEIEREKEELEEAQRFLQG